MPDITIAFLGDIFAAPGRQVVYQQLPNLRSDHAPDVVVANAENARGGSGLTPELYRKFRTYGLDGLTLGDHAFRFQGIAPILDQPDERLIRPANLPAKAAGRGMMRIPIAGSEQSMYMITVLGRIFMNLPSDDPFVTVDTLLQSIPEPKPLVIVEAHMEATSEKGALANYLDGRVTAVLGTHTHVPTADARILPGGTAFISDVGMCGAYRSVIGRDVESVVKHMSTGMYVPYGLGQGDEAMCGAVVRASAATGLATSIERIEYQADTTREPFVDRRSG